MEGTRTVICPLTGRLGSYVPGRDQRPGPPRMRGEAGEPSADGCPFCTGDVPTDPHPAQARRGQATWTSCPNRYPAIRGPGAAAHLSYALRHGPPLTSAAPSQLDDWAAMLDVQQQLARRSGSWSLVIVNVGPSAGSSQEHPHGQVLDLPEPPPTVVQRTRRLSDPTVAADVLADELTVETIDGVRVVVPAVPYGPGDLRLVPESDGSFLDADPDSVALAVTRWTAVSREDQPRSSAPDAKVIVHDRVGGVGRWYADLLATDRHGPVAGITPFVELDAPADVRAAELRARRR